MDYAVVELGGGQVKVRKGDIIDADYPKAGSKKSLEIGKVLMCHHSRKVEIGAPYIKSARVICDVLKKKKGRKLTAYKYKRRKSCKRKKGHRQHLVTLKVRDISFGQAK